MSDHYCHVIGCCKPAESEGLCASHFTRALIYGQMRSAAPRPAVAHAVSMRADA
ncbi:hypothetical protein D2E25_1719 [Bifidobacterium goeldii]|uniref:Uncharacterized protein n=1 Tax=Bifidobacterium goeldii TaxID=2306975 RepID=A0A430FFT0_9BIFI|nr:hypothetical protein D2E25_1719 [Bifidobacterium goeldii]